MMIETGARYLFIIMNADHNDKKGTHWWCFLDFYPKKETFLLDSFGFEGFKDFYCMTTEKCKIKYSMELKNLKRKRR